jgi:cytochrome c-type biogenesis protein CcmH
VRLAAPIATVAAALALAAGAGAAPSPADLEAELVCPTCHTTLDQSSAPVAQRMKQIIRQRIREGASERQIKAELVAQFGTGVLATPPKRGFDLLAWLLPLGGLAAGVVAVGALAWTWSRRTRVGGPEEPEPEPLDPALERRLDDELARFEG